MKSLGLRITFAVLSFGLVSIGASQAQAQKITSGPGCMSVERASELMRQFEFKEYLMLFRTVLPPLNVDTCSDIGPTSKVLNLVDFIDKIPSMDTGLENLPSNSIRETPGEFLRKRIRTFIVEQSCAPNQLAYVLPHENQTMHVCPELLKHTLDYGSSFIMHEARHIDGFEHVTCKRGHWKSFDQATGEKACDESYEAQGSYGIGIRYLLNVSRSEKVAPAVAQSARSWAAVEALSRFNQAPLDITQGGVFLSESGKVTFSDGEKSFELAQSSPGAMMVKSEPYTNQNFYVFDRSERNVYQFDSTLNKTEVEGGDVFVERFKSKTGQSLLDVADPDTGAALYFACFLSEKQLICNSNNGKEAVLAIKNFKPIALVRTSESYLLKAQTLYISAADGNLYEVPSDFNVLAKMKDTSRFAKSQTRYGMSSMIGWKNGGDLGVRIDGTVWAFDPASRAWNQLSIGEPTAKYKKVIGPYYWSPRLKDL